MDNQTSQYELLNKYFHLSHLGIFQYAREILKSSLPIYHPVLESTARHTGRVFWHSVVSLGHQIQHLAGPYSRAYTTQDGANW